MLRTVIPVRRASSSIVSSSVAACAIAPIVCRVTGGAGGTWPPRMWRCAAYIGSTTHSFRRQILPAQLVEEVAELWRALVLDHAQRPRPVGALGGGPAEKAGRVDPAPAVPEVRLLLDRRGAAAMGVPEDHVLGVDREVLHHLRHRREAGAGDGAAREIRVDGPEPEPVGDSDGAG